MKVIGLTGGIGTGKTTVAEIFKNKGYGVYNSDQRAKELMTEDTELKHQIIQLLGEESYLPNDELNRKFIAQKIFSNKELLKKQNALVHPAVAKDFLLWKEKQNKEFCIKEAAILFESGSYKQFDKVILVSAPLEIRIKRVKERDSASEEEIRKRIENQANQEELEKLADFVIENQSSLADLQMQIDKIIPELKK